MSAEFEKHSLKTVRKVDYTNPIPYNAKSCQNDQVQKTINSLKINSSAIKNPHAHFHYVHNKYARFQKDPLKTVEEVDYTNFIPYYAKKCHK